MRSASAAPVHGGPCSILALDMGNQWDHESLDSIGGFTYTPVTAAAFATTDLDDYDVLYVPSAFQDEFAMVPAQASLDALNARAADINDFVLGGGGVVALAEPVGTGRYTWTPMAVTPSAAVEFEEVLLTSPSHPVNTGLSSALLSFWFDSYHHSMSTIHPLFTTLATSTVPQPVSVAAVHGGGSIFLTGQDADYHAIEFHGSSAPDAGAATLLENALNWACVAGSPVGGDVVLPDVESLPVADAGAATPWIENDTVVLAVASAAALLLAGAATFVGWRRAAGR
jgi:hypothetical protein